MARVDVVGKGTGAVILFAVQIEVAAGVHAVARIETYAVASTRNQVFEITPATIERSPMSPALEGPNAIELPTSE
jgi:hypothetical protein